MASDIGPRGALGHTFRTYLNDPGLTPGSAAAVLRGSFLAVFAGQAVVAAAVAAVVALAAGRQDASSGWVAGVALLGAAGQMLLGLAITAAGVRSLRQRRPREDAPVPDDPSSDVRTRRSAALSQAVLSAVLLSTPAWFGAFAWVTGQTLVTLAGVAALAMLGYGAGMLMLASLAHAVSGPEPGREGAG